MFNQTIYEKLVQRVTSEEMQKSHEDGISARAAVIILAEWEGETSLTPRQVTRHVKLCLGCVHHDINFLVVGTNRPYHLDDGYRKSDIFHSSYRRFRSSGQHQEEEADYNHKDDFDISSLLGAIRSGDAPPTRKRGR